MYYFDVLWSVILLKKSFVTICLRLLSARSRYFCIRDEIFSKKRFAFSTIKFCFVFWELVSRHHSTFCNITPDVQNKRISYCCLICQLFEITTCVRWSQQRRRCCLFERCAERETATQNAGNFAAATVAFQHLIATFHPLWHYYSFPFHLFSWLSKKGKK